MGPALGTARIFVPSRMRHRPLGASLLRRSEVGYCAAVVEPPELTVVLTAHNRADLIDETLRALAAQEWDGSWDILLLDNDSTDETPAILESWLDRLPAPARIVTAADGHSPAYSRNTAAITATGRSMAFIDDDDLVGPGWVAAIGQALRDNPFVGSRFDYRLLNDEELADYRGSFQTTELGHLFGVPVVSSGGVGCRRELWLALGGQNEAIGYGGIDIEFALRANLKGSPPVLADGAIYHVRLREDARASFTQGRRFGRSRVTLYRLHRDSFGISPMPLTEVIRRWGGLVRRLPSIRRRGPRLVWCWQLGQRIGHLQGSAAARTWYP